MRRHFHFRCNKSFPEVKVEKIYPTIQFASVFLVRMKIRMHLQNEFKKVLDLDFKKNEFESILRVAFLQAGKELNSNLTLIKM